jgi:hypothetical protein
MLLCPGRKHGLRGYSFDSYCFDGFDGFNNCTQSNIREELQKYRPNLNATVVLDGGARVPKYLNMSTAECFEKYNSQYSSDVGNVYLIQNECIVWRNQDIWYLGMQKLMGEVLWFERSLPVIYQWQNNTDSTFPFISKPSSYLSNG